MDKMILSFQECEWFIENSSPEELQSYHESLGIDVSDYDNSYDFGTFVNAFMENERKRE